MQDRKIYVVLVMSIVLSLVSGITIGYFIAMANKANINNISSTIEATKNNVDMKVKNNSISIDDIKIRVGNFVNYKLLKPGYKAELKNYNEFGEFYRFNFTIMKENVKVSEVSVYTTRDGKYLILNLFELPEKINVSKQTTEKEITQDIDIGGEPTTGNKDSKVVIVEFSDYACPFCGKFARETLPKILKNLDVKYVFKDFPLPMHGEIAIKAHEAANCAGDQGKYWEYHDILFKRQNEWKRNASKFLEYAKELGLDIEEFKACLDSGKYREEVLKDLEEGKKLGVKGTPTFFINGKKLTGALPYEEFERVINELSKK